MGRTRKMTKRVFCKSAKRGTLKRTLRIKNFRKTAFKAARSRRAELSLYCKGAQGADAKFCRKAKQLSTKRHRLDKRLTSKLLKLANKRRRKLLKYCRK